MTKLVQPDELIMSRSGMSFLLAGLIVVLLPHLGHLPLWTSLSCFTLILWRLLYDMDRLPLPNKLVTFLIFILIILGVLAQYFTIVGREAGTALFISLICLKLFEIKSLRDISLIVQLAFFAIVVTFLFNQSIFVVLTMMAAVILLLTALISFQHAKSGVNRQGISEKTHLVLAMKMVIYAIPLAIVIFVLFPRTSTPLWGLPHDAFSAQTGLSEEMSPGKISNLVDSPSVAFRVKFQAALPSPAQMYWRGPVFWSFDGHTWSAPVSQRRVMRKISLLHASKAVDYTVTLEPHNNYWLFALDMPARLPDRSRPSTEMQLLTHNPVNHLLRYEMTSYLDYYLPWKNGLARDRYLALPAEAAPRARKYIKTLLQRYSDKQDIASAVLKRFSDKTYFYTRQPLLMHGDPTDAFLFDSKRGYCEHYASAFAVLMRLAGIPSRVVTGYQGGEMNPLSNYLIVRQSDAHAWSETYLDGKGWVRVDPTAAIPPGNIENTNDADRLRSDRFESRITINQSWLASSLKQLHYAWDAVNNRWNQWVIGYSNQNQKSLFRVIGIPEVTWRGLSVALFGALSFFVILIAINLFRAQWVKSDAIEKVYQQFLRKLGRFQYEKSPAEGALSFSQRVAQAIPDQSASLLQIASLYNQLRYAPSGQATLATLQHAIQSLRLTQP